MVNTLSQASEAQLQSSYGILPFILLEIPDNVQGLYYGPEPYTLGDIEYRPSRYLRSDDLVQTMGNGIEELTVTFAGIPTDDPDDLVNTLEETRYLGAAVTIQLAIIDMETDAVVGIAQTSRHEIFDLVYEQSAMAGDGTVDMTLEITLRSPGFSGRRQTNTLRTHEEQQADFDATDTFFENITEVETVHREWGQRSG